MDCADAGVGVGWCALLENAGWIPVAWGTALCQLTPTARMMNYRRFLGLQVATAALCKSAIGQVRRLRTSCHASLPTAAHSSPAVRPQEAKSTQCYKHTSNTDLASQLPLSALNAGAGEVLWSPTCWSFV